VSLPTLEISTKDLFGDGEQSVDDKRSAADETLAGDSRSSTVTFPIDDLIDALGEGIIDHKAPW
jgi:hypothetical protein